MASIASPRPLSLGNLDRARKPLAVAVTLLIAIDCIGLGMHLADAKRDAASTNQPENRARTSVNAPNAVVDSGSLTAGSSAGGRSGSGTRSGGLIGPVAPPVVRTPPPRDSNGGSTGGTPPPPPAPVPLAQTGAGIPALGSHVTAGVGEGSCTTVDLTVLALGDCPAPQGDGAVVLQLGGSLLGD